MPSLDDARDALRSATMAGPADARMIADAEGKLRVNFPSDYRTFLATFGAAMGRGYEIAGLFHASGSLPCGVM